MSVKEMQGHEGTRVQNLYKINAEKYGIEYQAGGNIVTWFSLILYR